MMVKSLKLLNKPIAFCILFDLSTESFDITKRLWITANPNLNLKEDNCYTIEGKYLGGHATINRLTGMSVNDTPKVELEKYTEMDCLDVKYPALKTLKINKSQTLGNVKLTLHQIQIAEEYSRALVEVENLGSLEGVVFL